MGPALQCEPCVFFFSFLFLFGRDDSAGPKHVGSDPAIQEVFGVGWQMRLWVKRKPKHGGGRCNRWPTRAPRPVTPLLFSELTPSVSAMQARFRCVAAVDSPSVRLAAGVAGCSDSQLLESRRPRRCNRNVGLARARGKGRGR